MAAVSVKRSIISFLGRFENPRRGGQARNLTTNVPKILDLKSSSEQIFSKNCRWVPLKVGNPISDDIVFVFHLAHGLKSPSSDSGLT